MSTSPRADRLGGIVGGESGSNHGEEKDVKYDMYRKERDEVRIGDYIDCRSERPSMLRYIIYQKTSCGMVVVSGGGRHGGKEGPRVPTLGPINGTVPCWLPLLESAKLKGRRGME